jgi:DNA gyrase subunit A
MSEDIKKISIEEEIKESYLDYSMSVIVGRALPDVRDGLKPVHRRILYAMNETGMHHDKPYKKSVRIVGEVMAKYHPHGDVALYQSIVRMAQDFNTRYLLVDGHGNYGSIDGDNAAAMRYTEARMSRISDELVDDIDKNTVDFRPNFDDTLTEPSVLPSKIPNLLLNGSSGIAVGMATNIPPHNLNEIIDATLAYIENRDISVMELMDHVKGPDFPTAGIIYGKAGIESAYTTGRGKIKVRARAHIEREKNSEAIIVTEIPYQVNKATLVEQIAELAKEKKIEGISDLRDESNREGIRIYIEIKKNEDAEIVLNKLYKYTNMQTTFGIIMIALDKNIPKVLNLKEIISLHTEHRVEVVTRRTQFDLDKSEKRHHILLGF